MQHDLNSTLECLRSHDLYRERRVRDGAQCREVVVGDRRYLSFNSNDYLGLAAHPEVIAAFQQAAAQFGVGSGSAHLVGGHTVVHHALEEELAAYTGRARALLFSTGYMANLGVVTALAGRGDRVLQDRLDHASLIDGARLSGARLLRYAHGDVEALRRRLAEQGVGHGRTLVATDGMFSMDGDLAPLVSLIEAAQEYGAWLMVDDAHGLGVIGPGGRGTVAHYGAGAEQVPVLVGTLGKAFGTFGAFVAGSEALIETLIQRARTYIFTTAPPPAVAAATRASLRLAQAEGWRREHLGALVRRFRAGALQLDLSLTDAPSAIQPLIAGSAGRALAWSEALARRGILVPAIRPPTVPPGSARLRITFSALHAEADVDRLLEALQSIVEVQGR